MPLDSSPIAEPPAPAHPAHGARPSLKRQHSTIPTPPQTQRKRVSRARPASAAVTGRVGKLIFPGQPARKRAKLDHPAEGGSTTLTSLEAEEPAAEASHTELPFSNPAVHRFKTPSPPSTPVRKPSRFPLPVDAVEEDNPFLVSPEEEARMLARRRERELSGESTGGFGLGNGEEMMTYVFRGVRQQAPNPLYNRPLTTQASQLPLAHPDYSPPPAAPPRLLFPPGQSKAQALASIDKHGAAAGKLRAWVGNVELPLPALGLGLELEEPMDLDVHLDEVGEVGRVVGMMPLVGRQGRENVALPSRRPIR
ncbi:hypothetical protein CALVIDRAFT_559067 [Calocera viscosa TUFC12733]|uniref:Uncharacterized protein n=1 Tax=Calocera viscosa (strain TUFC12733) TaxID=1330018 RepID=A0A167FQ34_CALVF|nr:hypothetical protein CALVIDRAFT_559067 [Calocera viscosa TUFC12733]